MLPYLICQHNTYTIPRIYTQSESALLTLSRSTRCAACSQGYGGLLKFASFKNVFGCYAETIVPLFIFVHIDFRALMLWSLPPWTSQETVLYTLPQTMGKFLPGIRGTTHASCTGRQTTQRLVCVLYMLNCFFNGTLIHTDIVKK